eukprot:5232997-Alexandrium_andersonii.AAC.1
MQASASKRRVRKSCRIRSGSAGKERREARATIVGCLAAERGKPVRAERSSCNAASAAPERMIQAPS